MKYFLLLACLVLHWSCSQEQTLESPETDLSIRVTGIISDIEGDPLVDVEVFNLSDSLLTQSDSMGQYRIDFDDYGTYELLFRAEGFKDTVIDNFEITSEAELIIWNLVLYTENSPREFGSITGVIIDSNSEETLSNIMITIDTLSFSTDSVGKFSLSNLTMGSTNLVFSRVDCDTLILSDVDVLSQTDLGQIQMNCSDDEVTINSVGSLQGTLDPLPSEQITVTLQSINGQPITRLNTTTGDNGKFQFLNIVTGDYLLFTSGSHKSDTLTIQIDSDTLIDTVISGVEEDVAKLNLGLSAKVTEGTAYGLDSSILSDLDSVIVTVANSDSSYIETYTLTFDDGGNILGDVYIPAINETFTALLYGYDADMNTILFNTISFNRFTGTIIFDPVDVWNAKPSLDGSITSEVSIFDEIPLNVSGVSGTLPSQPSVEWKAKGENTWNSIVSEPTAPVPGVEDSVYWIDFRISDELGNSVTHRLNTRIVIDLPTVDIITKTEVDANQILKVTAIATDSYSIDPFVYEFSQDDVNYTAVDTFEAVWPIEGNYWLYVKVTDDDNNTIKDSIGISVLEALPLLQDSRDGKTYRYTTVGSQTWMAENLKYELNDTTIAKCYNNLNENCDQYGVLYSSRGFLNTNDPNAVNEAESVKFQGICPSGWHVPTFTEWDQLIGYIANQEGVVSYFGAGFLKANLDVWKESLGPYEDKYRMSIGPYGGYFRNDSRNEFAGLNLDTVLWSRTKDDTETDHFKALVITDNTNAEFYANYKDDFHYLRCVMD